MHDAEPPPPVSVQPEQAPPKPRRASSVGDLGLSVVRVQMTSVLCLLEQAEQLSLIPSAVGMHHEGKLVPGSRTPSGFRAEISWAIEIPKRPLTIAGKHVVVYATARPATTADAEFYSQVNAVVLAHPYIRQLVDDLSAKCLGQSVMVDTLDVLDFVKKATAKFQEGQSQAQAAGTGDA